MSSAEKFTIETETDSERKHAEHMGLAFEKFAERNEVYKDLWKDDDIEGTVAHVKHKAMRVGRLTDPESMIDDAIDLVNYAVFLLRLVTGDEAQEASDAS